jgi:hypothetical protein
MNYKPDEQDPLHVEKKPAFGVFSLLYLNPIRVVLAPNQYS